MSELSVAGPAWDLSSEYSSATAPEIDRDLASFDAHCAQIESLNKTLVPLLVSAADLALTNAGTAIDMARQIHGLEEAAYPLLSNPQTYASCLLSVDARDAAAQELQGRLQHYQTRFSELLEPHAQFLKSASDEVVDAYLNHSSTAARSESVV